MIAWYRIYQLIVTLASAIWCCEAFSLLPSSQKTFLSFDTRTQPVAEAAAATAATGTVVEHEAQAESVSLPPKETERRILGSQENLMLPRQYSPGKHVFPSMNHVCTAVLSCTPSLVHLQTAIDEMMEAHPLLRCYIEGDGEPDERIDFFQMVRKGEPNPATFCSSESVEFTSQDVLRVISVSTSDREALDISWKATFEKDIDDGSWCIVEEGPLWKVEFHCCKEKSDAPCALVFSFNHAISDQSSANRMIDEIVANLAALEETGLIKTKCQQQSMPVSVEDSVLGMNKRWHDVQFAGVSAGTIKYIAGKAAEGFRSPVILPDSEEDGKSGPLSSLSIIAGKAAGGEDKGSESRKSTLQYRTLSVDTTVNLLEKCRANRVSVSNALTAAMTLTSTDFIDGGTPQIAKKRNYKVLQSLDLRRYGEQLDKGETVGCLAGSMDLMHGPLPDRSGESLRTNPTPEKLELFWKLGKDGRDQLNDFIASGGPSHAMRVFDFAMTISDLNNLVYLTAQSKDSKGRAYSAGVTNCGVYERQEAFRRTCETARSLIKAQHGRYVVRDIFYAVSHARSGCLYQLSCLTLGGEMKLTFHPASPVVSEETNARFADAFVELVETVSSH